MQDYHVRMNGLVTRRDEAAHHLVDLMSTQTSNAEYIPAIAVAMQISLSNIIEKHNDLIEELNLEYNRKEERTAMQLSFDFLCECLISPGEVPF